MGNISYRPPLVLFLGHEPRLAQEISDSLNSPLNSRLRGGRDVRIITHNSSELGRWWLTPTRKESLQTLLMDVKPSMSMNRALAWVETPQFVSFVRREILKSLTIWLQKQWEYGASARFDKSWIDAVEAVILSGGFWPQGSPYVCRVFDGFFPNAGTFMASHGDGVVPVSLPDIIEREQRARETLVLTIAEHRAAQHLGEVAVAAEVEVRAV